MASAVPQHATNQEGFNPCGNLPGRLAMCRYLFAYGTLQPGLAPPEIAPLVARLEPLGPGSIPGLLYDLGEYPGAILDPASPRTIWGTVFKLPADPTLLVQLDA